MGTAFSETVPGLDQGGPHFGKPGTERKLCRNGDAALRFTRGRGVGAKTVAGKKRHPSVMRAIWIDFEVCSLLAPAQKKGKKSLKKA